MTKLIPILSGRCLVVELPETKWPYRNLNYKIRAELGKPLTGKMLVRGSNSAWQEFDLPAGKWLIVGMLSDVTEEQAAELVDDVRFGNSPPLYLKYTPYNGRDFRDVVENAFDSAIESLESSILAEGYTFSPVIPWLDRSESEIRELESRVLSRERCLLLGREG